MLPFTDAERASVVDYFISQSKDASVKFAQKVYAETVAGHRHEVWDLHADDGRWWVITNPTNLYSQDQFPNMDLAVTFHLGLCLRIPRTQKVPESRPDLAPFAKLFPKVDQLEVALHQADSLLAYQSVGVGCRELLIEFVQTVQSAWDWPENDLKASDVKGWIEVILSEALSGSSNEQRRKVIRSAGRSSWDFSNWLTHAKSASWHDAETSWMQLSHALGLLVPLMVRFARGVPEECPECGSPSLFPQTGFNEELPEIEWERPVCGDCGWNGEPVPVRELSSEEMIEREGLIENECYTAEVPLDEVRKPGEQ